MKKARRIELYSETLSDGDYNQFQVRLVLIEGEYTERVAFQTLYHGPAPYQGQYSKAPRTNERLVIDAMNMTDAALIRGAIEAFDGFKQRWQP